MPNPRVDDYPSDPGDHGIMARYQSFRLSPGADAALEFLEALFVLHDEFDKEHKGYITLMKIMGCMFEENGVVFDPKDDLTDSEGDFITTLSKNLVWFVPQLFDAMECQYALVQPQTENPFKTFRKPTIPVLTRTGFIKFVLVGYLDRMSRGDHRPYNILYAITEKYRLLVPGTARPVMPIDDRKQVEKNFRDLAVELQIPLDRIIRQIRNFRGVPPGTQPVATPVSPPVPTTTSAPPKKAPRRNSSYTPSLTGSDATSKAETADYTRYRDHYSSSSRTYRRSPSPTEPYQNIKPKPTYFSPPPAKPQTSRPYNPTRKSAADIQREKELELKAAEKELKDLEEHYERMAKEREMRNEMEYIEAQKRGTEKATRGVKESMRRLGLEEYYDDYRDRDRYRY